MASLEDFMKEHIGKSMMRCVKDRDSVLRDMVDVMSTSNKIQQGQQKFKAALEKGITPEDGPKIMKTTVRDLSVLAGQIHKLSSVLMLYVMSDDFVPDAAKIASRMGYGEEALKEMFNQKMRGKKNG